MTLAVNLSTIKESHKKALLKEYFELYKMVYRIRSIVSYHWDRSKDALMDIKNLYFNDDTFKKMILMVQQHVINLFEGTNKKHVLL